MNTSSASRTRCTKHGTRDFPPYTTFFKMGKREAEADSLSLRNSIRTNGLPPSGLHEHYIDTRYSWDAVLQQCIQVS